MASLKLMMVLLLSLLVLPLATAGVHAAPGGIALVSTNAAGVYANDDSVSGRISSDGRYVAFVSTSTNLVSPATAGQEVFRKDLLTGEVQLASANAAGVQGNGISNDPAISPDGRYVTFQSQSTNLVTPSTTGQEVFRKDMLTGEVRLVSANAEGAEGTATSYSGTISPDGRYVAFHSFSANLVTTAISFTQIFRKDLLTGEVMLVSADAAGTPGDDFSQIASISSNGRYVAFSSYASNLVTPATGALQAFRKDILTGEIRLVSSDAAGAEGNGTASFPSISDDGRFVAFHSTSTELVTPNTTGQQVFRKDMLTSEVRLVSADAAGALGNGTSSSAAISSDGRYVAFQSASTNLVTPNTTGQQIFRKDMVTGEILLASATTAGVQGNFNSSRSSITSDGRYVAFQSTATNLVAPATTGVQIFRKELAAPYYFYFAEGYTGSGFQEYLCLGNASAAAITVKATYLFRDGTTKEETYGLMGNSRRTVNVNAVVGPDKEVSIRCESESAFIAERPMYFDYQGKWTGGHDAVGATAPALAWYFAEGYTGAGFDEWICVLNPGDLPANLTFFFQTQEEGEKKVEGFSVGAHTRQTFKANQLLGGGSFQTSLRLTSDHPVVAERPMYFSYSGTAGYGWTGGSCVMGVPLLSSSYYFAEGTTRAGFEEWITLQNPGTADITVHATYNLGSGTPVTKDYVVPAGKRSTILVNSPEVGVGPEKDVSVLLTCPSPFLAERPMYFDYQGLGNHGWTGGHCVIGATAPAAEWFFAEGYTGSGFEEWLCIQNPGGTDAALTIIYYPEGGGAAITRTHTVSAGTRFTVPVNVDAGANQSISAKVSSTQPVIVERPMYFNFNNAWSGGHDVVGYVP
jgi:Tol biopolymer transport system component